MFILVYSTSDGFVLAAVCRDTGLSRSPYRKVRKERRSCTSVREPGAALPYPSRRSVASVAFGCSAWWDGEASPHAWSSASGKALDGCIWIIVTTVIMCCNIMQESVYYNSLLIYYDALRILLNKIKFLIHHFFFFFFSPGIISSMGLI